MRSNPPLWSRMAVPCITTAILLFGVVLSAQGHRGGDLRDPSSIAKVEDGVAKGDSAGALITSCRYDTLFYDSVRQALVVMERGKMGILRSDSSVAIPPIYDDIGRMIKGNHFVVVNGKIGVVNAVNDRVLPCRYRSVEEAKGDFAQKAIPMEYVPLDHLQSTLTCNSTGCLPNRGKMLLLTSMNNRCEQCTLYMKEVLSPFAWECDFIDFYYVDMWEKCQTSTGQKTRERLRNKFGSELPLLVYMGANGNTLVLQGVKDESEVRDFMEQCIQSDARHM